MIGLSLRERWSAQLKSWFELGWILSGWWCMSATHLAWTELNTALSAVRGGYRIKSTRIHLFIVSSNSHALSVLWLFFLFSHFFFSHAHTCFSHLEGNYSCLYSVCKSLPKRTIHTESVFEVFLALINPHTFQDHLHLFFLFTIKLTFFLWPS